MMRLFATGAVIGLTACQARHVQAIDYRAISSVEADIKRQIGVYLAAASRPAVMRDMNGELVTLPTDQALFACGAGGIGFDILNIKADLLTTTETNLDAKLSASTPVHAVTVGPSGELTSDRSTTQELVYNVWFDPLSEQQGSAFLYQTITDETLRDAPIASVLLNLRSALIASGMNVDPYTHKQRKPMPCHWDWNIDPKKPGGDPGDTMKMGITVVRDAKLGLDLKVSVVDIGLSNEWKSTTGNTLTVSFYQAGTLDAQPDKEQAVPKPKKRQVGRARPASALLLNGPQWSPGRLYLLPAQFVSEAPRATGVSSPENKTLFPQEGIDPCDQICKEKGQSSVSCLKCKHIGEDMVPYLRRQETTPSR